MKRRSQPSVKRIKGTYGLKLMGVKPFMYGGTKHVHTHKRVVSFEAGDEAVKKSKNKFMRGRQFGVSNLTR